MIWETSLLHYPDYRGKDIPYDEYILDDEKGKIGFYFELLLSDGTHVKFPNTKAELNITVPAHTSLYIEKFAFHCSKDFDPGEIRFQPYFQRTFINSAYGYKKHAIENHYFVEKEYLNDLIFTKETRGTLLVEGEKVDPKKTKRKKAKAETVYYFITDDEEDYQVVTHGSYQTENYVFGIRITNHWDVKINGAYHNKLYMLNDDCDGFIWEKKHNPDEYVLIFAEWYASYYWHYKNMIVYPNDQYAITDGLTGVGATNQCGITRDFFVRSYWYGFYDIGGNWITTKDGHDWVACEEHFRPSAPYWCKNWSPDSNYGLLIRGNDIYRGEVKSSGQIHFEKVGTTEGISIVGYGNGYIFYTKNRDTSKFKTIYRRGADSFSESSTCLNTSEYTVDSMGPQNRIIVISGHFIEEEIKNERFVGISRDGFNSVEIYSTIDGGIPRYGDNFALHYWGKDQVYWTCRRQDPKDPSKYYCDVGGLGGGGGYTYQWGDRNVKHVQICGAGSSDLSKAYYKDVSVDGDEIALTYMVPDSPNMNGCMYFSNGKPSYPFGWGIVFWSAWNGVIVPIFIGNCDRWGTSPHAGDTPPYTGTRGSFAFDLTGNYMIDPDNETWIYPYG